MRRVRCYPGQTRIRILYYAAPNANTQRGGYCPVYRINTGREHGHSFCSGLDKDQALRRARQDALDEAAKYRGDWCVSVMSSARGRRR